MKKLLYIKLLIPLFCFAQLTPCQQEVANLTGMPGEYAPQCDEDGSYSSIQCWLSTGYCWCVDVDGIEIPGTSIQSWLGDPDCDEVDFSCFSPSGIGITTVGYWENPNDPCETGECTSDGQFVEIIIDCMEEMGIPCNGEWVEVEGQCCSECIETETSYCDSISLNPFLPLAGSFDDALMVNMVTYFTNYSIPYAGLMLLDYLGDTIAIETLSSAGNVYAIGSNVTETRNLLFVNELVFPFTGELCVVEFLFAGTPNIVCSYPVMWEYVGLSQIENETEVKLVKMLDILGREQSFHSSGQILFYIYENGKVEKRIIE